MLKRSEVSEQHERPNRHSLRNFGDEARGRKNPSVQTVIPAQAGISILSELSKNYKFLI
jgi:hypothetical protein